MKSFAAFTVFAALATAIPHAKRDVVWVTATDVVTEVVDVTKTVWIESAEATASPASQAQEKYVPAPAPVNGNNQNHNHADYHGGQKPQTTISTVVVSSTTPSATPIATTPAIAPTTAVQPVVTSTTSVYIAPSPQTTPLSTAAPSSETTPLSTAAPSSAPAAYSPPASYGGSGSSSGGGNGCASSSGTCDDAKFTYYTPGMGSCGKTNVDSDFVFAYGKDKMAAVGGANPNLNPLCGRKIAIKAFDGTEITATLVDTCYACTSDGMLDLSTDLWNRIADGMPGADGVLHNMEYRWM